MSDFIKNYNFYLQNRIKEASFQYKDCRFMIHKENLDLLEEILSNCPYKKGAVLNYALSLGLEIILKDLE